MEQDNAVGMAVGVLDGIEQSVQHIPNLNFSVEPATGALGGATRLIYGMPSMHTRSTLVDSDI